MAFFHLSLVQHKWYFLLTAHDHLLPNGHVHCDVVYFDFRKAFDSANHDIILWKLKHQFKIDGRLLKFCVNYLQHRFQRIVINSEMSSFKPVTSTSHCS